MTRRDWLAGSLAASSFGGLSAASTGASSPGSAGPAARDFYELKRYQLRSGPEPRLLDAYLREAAVPALNRVGVKPVGVFTGVIGPESPCTYVLVPYSSLDTMTKVRNALARDEEYQRQAADYLNALASQPVYVRFEMCLLEAFETVPRIEVSAAAAGNQPRIFEPHEAENV
jgi:hypothetical protein